jgi:beta-fructofuranosidase
MEDHKGRRLLWGWIPGFREDQGWQGAMTLPRNLSVSRDGWLIQEPVEELKELRGKHTLLENIFLENETMPLEIPGREFEVKGHFNGGNSGSYGLRFRLEDGQDFEISVEPDLIHFGPQEIPLTPFELGNSLDWQLFCDRTILELYVNGGLICATSVVYPDWENPDWELYAEGTKLEVQALDFWTMKSIYSIQ